MELQAAVPGVSGWARTAMLVPAQRWPCGLSLGRSSLCCHGGRLVLVQTDGPVLLQVHMQRCCQISWESVPFASWKQLQSCAAGARGVGRILWFFAGETELCGKSEGAEDLEMSPWAWAGVWHRVWVVAAAPRTPRCPSPAQVLDSTQALR